MKTFTQWLKETLKEEQPDAWHEIYRTYTEPLTKVEACHGEELGFVTVEGYGPNDACPTCGKLPEWTCKCHLRDSGCSEGHTWHTCPTHKVKVIGRSDHSVAKSCTCH